MTDIIIHPGVSRYFVLGRIRVFISSLACDKTWHIQINEWKGTRSQQQNRALWGLAYATILKEGGEAMAGWDAEDLHEYFLGEKWGWEVAELFGKKRQRPIRRSSKLNKQEFAEFFDFVQRKAAEFGVFIPDPDPMRKYHES